MNKLLPWWKIALLCLCLLLQGGWTAVNGVRMALMTQAMQQTHCGMAATELSSASEHCGHGQPAAEKLLADQPSPAHHASGKSKAHDHDSADKCDCQCDCQKDCLRGLHSAFSLPFLAARAPAKRAPQPMISAAPAPFQPEVDLRPPITLS